MDRKEYMRQYQREWMRRRRQSYFDDKVCAACGSSENLELDHIDETVKVDHRIWSWSQERREVELAKCQPLCESCHQEKTSAMWSARRVHGRTMYEYHGCRCDVCKEAKSKNNAKRYRKAP